MWCELCMICMRNSILKSVHGISKILSVKIVCHVLTWWTDITVTAIWELYWKNSLVIPCGGARCSSWRFWHTVMTVFLVNVAPLKKKLFILAILSYQSILKMSSVYKTFRTAFVDNHNFLWVKFTSVICISLLSVE